MSVDLSTTYLGMTLKSPIVVSACPLSGYIDMLLRMEEAGAAAIVMQSLFEEQIEHEETKLHAAGTPMADPASFVPGMDEYNAGVESYLRHVEVARKSIKVPLIGSLNAGTKGDWPRFARLIADAGADALELNIYFVPTSPTMTSEDVEKRYIEMLAEVRGEISLPIAVKIGPYFSALPYFAKRLINAGAKGLVLFNRYFEPEIDLERLEVTPFLSFSHEGELRLPLRWIAILRDQLIDASFAATSGVHTSDDVVRAVLAGADVVEVASVLLRKGPPALRELTEGLTKWLADRDYKSIGEIRGIMSRGRIAHPSSYERANYMKALLSYMKGKA